MRRVVAINEPRPMESNSAVLYSANPLEVTADDHLAYVLKGPAREPTTGIAFAEAAAYELAGELGLAVPPHAVCFATSGDGSGLYFASQKLNIRLPVEGLVESGQVRNPEVLSEMIAFDLWVGNSDRNIGNVVGETATLAAGGGVLLRAIDFEQAEVLRGRLDRFSITAMESRDFWPREGLGRICRQHTTRPSDFLDRIAARARADNRAVLMRAIWALDMPAVPWVDMATDLLATRAGRIHAMAQEVWS